MLALKSLRALSFACLAAMAQVLMAAPVAFAVPSGALPPINTGAIVRQATGPTIVCLGDSSCATANFNNPAGSAYYQSFYIVGTSANSELGWLDVFSNHGFTFANSNFGYPGSIGGFAYFAPITSGTCTPNATLTFSPSASPGTSGPANNASAITLTTNASGGVNQLNQKIIPSNGGSGYFGLPTWTITGGSCSVQPVFAYALSGYGNFGVPGDVTQSVLWRAHYDVCPAQPDIVVLEAGGNDLAFGGTYASVTANYQSIIQTLQNCGIQRIVIAPITPRNQGSSGVWSAAMDKWRIRVNRWSQAYVQQLRLANPSSQVVAMDVDHYWADPTQSGSTIGNPIAGMTYDGLHESPMGAFYWGLSLFNVIKNWAAPSIYMPNSQSDYYDATNNPAGNLLGTTQGLMIGTSGTASGTCTTSSGVATGWTLSGSMTGTDSCVGTIETTRTDGLAGQRQVITVTESGGGTTDSVKFQLPSISTSNITMGTDKLYGSVDIDISNMSNVLYVGCLVGEANTVVQYGYGMNSGNVGYALPSSATIAKLSDAKVLPDYGLTAAGSFKMNCKTDVIKTQAGSTNYFLNIYAYMNASTSASVTLKISNAAVRKVAP